MRILCDVNILVRANDLDKDFYDKDTVAFCAALGIDVCTDVELAVRIGRIKS